MRRRSIALGAAACLVAVVAWTAPAAAASGLAGEVFEHRKPPLRLAIPEGWRATAQTGYPALLLRLTRDGGAAVVTLARAVLKAPAPDELKRFVEQNVAALDEVGIRVERSAPGQLTKYRGWIVDGTTDGGALALRQVYIQHGRHALVWTVTCPRKELAVAKVELERMFENLTLR